MAAAVAKSLGLDADAAGRAHVLARCGGAVQKRDVWARIGDIAFGTVCAVMLTGYLFYYAFGVGETELRVGAIASAGSVCAIAVWAAYTGAKIKSHSALLVLAMLWQAVEVLGGGITLASDMRGEFEVATELGRPILAAGAVMAGALALSRIRQSGWGFDLAFCGVAVTAIMCLLIVHYGAELRLAGYETFRLQARGEGAILNVTNGIGLLCVAVLIVTVIRMCEGDGGWIGRLVLPVAASVATGGVVLTGSRAAIIAVIVVFGAMAYSKSRLGIGVLVATGVGAWLLSVKITGDAEQMREFVERRLIATIEMVAAGDFEGDGAIAVRLGAYERFLELVTALRVLGAADVPLAAPFENAVFHAAWSGGLVSGLAGVLVTCLLIRQGMGIFRRDRAVGAGISLATALFLLTNEIYQMAAWNFMVGLVAALGCKGRRRTMRVEVRPGRGS